LKTAGRLAVFVLMTGIPFSSMTKGVVWAAHEPDSIGSALGQTRTPVRVEALIDNFRIVRGKPFVVRVQLTVNSGFHINSNKPKDKYLIPTQVKIDPISGVLFGSVKFPPAKEAKFQFSSEPLSVFEGEVQLEIPAQSSRTLPLGKKAVTGKVIYQACDNDTCYPPRTVPFEIPVDVDQ
jgi:DsbC/DsbD-like thiol-disulfide interchange protein